MVTFFKAVGQEIIPIATLEPEKPLLDEYYEFAPSSTVEVAGIMTATTRSNFDPQYFYSYVPGNSKSYLCVNILSIDGRYKGIWTYKLKNDETGWIKLELPTKYQSNLKKYNSEDIGIKATLSDKCFEDNTSAQTISTWVPKTSDSTAIYLSTTEEVNLIAVDSKGKIFLKERFKEIRINGIPTKSYNRVCVISNDILEYDLKLQYRVIDGYRKKTTYKDLYIRKIKNN